MPVWTGPERSFFYNIDALIDIEGNAMEEVNHGRREKELSISPLDWITI